MKVLKNIKRSFQSVRKDMSDMKNMVSKLSVDVAALTARLQKMETDSEAMKSAAKGKKRKYFFK